MTELADVDYFTDADITQDPYAYWDYLRSEGPVVREPHHGVVAVTGYQEVQAAFKDVESFSAVNAIGGPFPPLPFTARGRRHQRARSKRHRHEFPIFEHMVVMDPPEHEKARSLLSRLLTPRRLKENEDYIWSLAIDSSTSSSPTADASSSASTAKPFATLAIADLLGVPEQDRAEDPPQPRRRRLAGWTTRLAASPNPSAATPCSTSTTYSADYIAERRITPREDVLTGLATATYPDGSIPPLLEVVRPATFLFGAGQETVTKLLSSAVQVLGDRPELQDQLRADRTLIRTIHRRGPAIAEPNQGRLPTRPQIHHARRRAHQGRYCHHAVLGGREP